MNNLKKIMVTKENYQWVCLMILRMLYPSVQHMFELGQLYLGPGPNNLDHYFRSVRNLACEPS